VCPSELFFFFFLNAIALFYDEYILPLVDVDGLWIEAMLKGWVPRMMDMKYMG